MKEFPGHLHICLYAEKSNTKISSIFYINYITPKREVSAHAQSITSHTFPYDYLVFIFLPSTSDAPPYPSHRIFYTFCRSRRGRDRCGRFRGPLSSCRLQMRCPRPCQKGRG